MAPRDGQFDPSILLKILQSVAGQNAMTMPLLSSIPAGLSASGITSTMNPEVLFASGVFDPYAVNAGIEAALQGQQSQYARDILNATQLPPAPFEYYSYKNDATYNNDPTLRAFMEDAFALIQGGESGFNSPEAAKASLAQTISSTPELSQYSGLLPKLQNDIDTFISESQSNARARAEYDFKTQNAMAEANARAEALGLAAPTRQSAMAEYYKSIGAPQLALLPDPTEQFQLDPSIFMSAKDLSQAGQLATQLVNLRKQAGSLQNAPDLPTAVVSAQGEQDKMARSAAEAAAKRIAESKKQEFITQQTSARKPAKNKAWYDPRFYIDTTIGTDASDKNKKAIGNIQVRADALYKKVFAEELAKGLKKYGKTITPQSIRPTLGSVTSQINKNEALLKKLLATGVQGSIRGTQMLTSSGVTPFSQAMNQILTNASLQGTRRK